MSARNNPLAHAAAPAAQLGQQQGVAATDSQEPFNLTTAVEELMLCAADRLSVSELAMLAGASDAAATQAAQAEGMANRLGVLVGGDGVADSLRQPQDVAAVLFHLAATFGNVAALAALGGKAAELLAERAAKS